MFHGDSSFNKKMLAGYDEGMQALLGGSDDTPSASERGSVIITGLFNAVEKLIRILSSVFPHKRSPT